MWLTMASQTTVTGDPIMLMIGQQTHTLTQSHNQNIGGRYALKHVSPVPPPTRW